MTNKKEQQKAKTAQQEQKQKKTENAEKN